MEAREVINWAKYSNVLIVAYDCSSKTKTNTLESRTTTIFARVNGRLWSTSLFGSKNSLGVISEKRILLNFTAVTHARAHTHSQFAQRYVFMLCRYLTYDLPCLPHTISNHLSEPDLRCVIK